MTVTMLKKQQQQHFIKSERNQFKTSVYEIYLNLFQIYDKIMLFNSNNSLYHVVVNC